VPLAEKADGAEIAVLGIPSDTTTTGRPGARFGPRAILEQSLQAGEFEWSLFPWKYEVRDMFSCVDLGDVTGFTAYTDRIAPAIEKKADTILDTGASLLSLGGDQVEVSPHYDGPSQVTALAGATIAGDILYLIAGGRRALGLKSPEYR